MGYDDEDAPLTEEEWRGAQESSIADQFGPPCSICDNDSGFNSCSICGNDACESCTKLNGHLNDNPFTAGSHGFVICTKCESSMSRDTKIMIGALNDAFEEVEDLVKLQTAVDNVFQAAIKQIVDDKVEPIFNKIFKAQRPKGGD